MNRKFLGILALAGSVAFIYIAIWSFNIPALNYLTTAAGLFLLAGILMHGEEEDDK